MDDSLWDDNPKAKQIQAKAQEIGFKEGLEQGRAYAMRNAILKIVKNQFPNLVSEAETTIAQFHSPEALTFLLDQLLDAPNETIARFLLHLPAA